MVHTVVFGGDYITQRLDPGAPLRLTGPGNPRCWPKAFGKWGNPTNESVPAPMVRTSGEEHTGRGATVVAKTGRCK